MRNNAAFKAAARASFFMMRLLAGLAILPSPPGSVRVRTNKTEIKAPLSHARQCFHNLGAVAPSDSLGEGGGGLRCKGGIMPGALQLARQPEQYVTFVISSDW
jgi:hypothetical protein